MFWERSGGVGEVRPVWKEGEGGGGGQLCAEVLSPSVSGGVFSEKVRCCFRNNVTLSSLQTLSSSLKPTPPHSQSGRSMPHCG